MGPSEWALTVGWHHPLLALPWYCPSRLRDKLSRREVGTPEPVCAQESGAAFGRTCPKTMNVNVKILSLTNPSCLRAGFLQVAITTTVMRHIKSFESHQIWRGGQQNLISMTTICCPEHLLSRDIWDEARIRPRQSNLNRARLGRLQQRVSASLMWTFREHCL